MPIRLAAALAGAVLLASSAAHAQADMPGSADHPDIPRIAGSRIVAFARSDYGEGVFHGSTANRSLNEERAEGALTRIVYQGGDGLSPLGALRNYQAALAELGDVEEVFTCRGNECFRNLGGAFIWAENRRIPTVLEVEKYLYHQPYYYQDQVYWYGKVHGDAAEYVVSVYAATRSSDDNFVDDRADLQTGDTLVHLDIVEQEAFTPTLEVVDAGEIAEGIAQKGHVALYGIYFDTGSDALDSESRAAIDEIVTALQNDPGLSVYVVGHTDNVGSVEDNRALSERRAASVVRALVSEHGIDAGRLAPLGAGLAAPVASNDTEDGRALNRRVELVKR
jgi:outer membrane protein OmpA-like peptidoglycan-associated protein